MFQIRTLTTLALSGALALGAAACGEDEAASGGGGLSGQIRIDGSSTVYPFAQAAAEQFMGENPGVQVSVGQSGTGGGFEKFCAGETDIFNATRQMKKAEEAPDWEKAGVSYEEVQVGNAGIAAGTNPGLEVD